MTTTSVLLWCFGVMAALVGLCWIVSFFRKHFESEQFDERQKQVRGQANSLAMGFGYTYFLVVFVALRMEWDIPLSAANLMMLGILMQAMILHFYAMLHNAELPLGKKHWTSVLLYCFMGFCQLAIFRDNQEKLRIAAMAEEQGVDLLGVSMEAAREDTYLFLVYSVIFFSLAAMHLIRILWPERE